MLQLGMKDKFGCQFLKWYETVVPMKELGNLMGQPYLTKRKMREVVIQTAEPYFTREATERMVKNT